jgi:hypothetical protein
MAANRQTQGNLGFGGDIPSGSFNPQRLDAAKYISLYDLVNKPDNRDALIKTYGFQGITGFLQLVGATKAVAQNDEVQYWEETRLHKMQKGTFTAVTSAQTANASATFTVDTSAHGTNILRVGDVVLLAGSYRGYVSAVSTATDPVVTIKSLDGTLPIITAAALGSLTQELPIIGNLYAQGSDQPDSFFESGIVKRTNKFNIMKEVYSVTGSQATNIGWINLGNGDYRWYLKSEADTRQRFMDKREMMMLLSQNVNNTGISDINGSEGYFAAIEDRGIVQSGYIDTMTEIDDIVKVFDKEGAASEYALYVNRTQDLKIDDLLAKLGDTTTTGSARFGSFQNSPEMALNLGFRSFNRAGYTFHKHDWKLLNDPTLLADSDFYGVAVPMASVADASTGEKSPALEMNYKAANGYSREMEHWMIGSVLGASNATKDNVEFHYRSEANLITRAANRHMLIKK